MPIEPKPDRINFKNVFSQISDNKQWIKLSIVKFDRHILA